MVAAWLLVAIVAYLLGSVPSGLLIGRLFFGIDVRDYGSRRTGATNVLRTMGAGAGIAALVADMTKAVLAVLFARWLLPGEPWAHVLAGTAATAGHNWPAWVGFRGGRGVIVSGAAVGVLHLPVLLVVTVIGLSVVWRTRYVSLGSLVGAALAPPLFVLFYLRGDVPLAYVAYGTGAAVMVIVSHRDNIARLLAGTESRLGQRAESAA